MLSDELLEPLEESFTLSAPDVQDCAFEPYCGADPVFHHATMGDFRRPQGRLSGFCQRNMGDLHGHLAASPRRSRTPATSSGAGAQR